ncbi:MAG TPA: fructose 1,6-bisphosphatase, partial [Solirubrobacteraceae bacterium]|nr:fructose 1,6-bisphosphatase [Solirubrobacteraceae bacterium]
MTATMPPLVLVMAGCERFAAGLPRGAAARLVVERFPNGELHARAPLDMAGRDCLLVGSISPPPGNLERLTLAVHTLRRAFFSCPEDLYDLLVYIGTTGRFVIKHVFRRGNLDEPVASTSTSRLSLIAGRYVGKDDPIMVVRCQSGLPAVGEVLEPFSAPHYV